LDEYGQISIEQYMLKEKIGKQPKRTAFIDECGNFGFAFDKQNVSSHYIVCAVIVDNNKITEIENKISEIQKVYFNSKEMKSSSIGQNNSRRAKLIGELINLDFQLIILIADKRAFYDHSHLKEYKSSFIKFLHEKLYNTMYCVYPKLKIVKNEFGTSEFQKGYRKYICEHRPENNLFNEYDFDYIDSKQSNLVQIADIVAGSVMKHITDSKAPDILKIFKSKIVGIVNFPDLYLKYSLKTERNEFDDLVYQLAYKCSTDYIKKNEKSDVDVIRLRVLFLKMLVYNVIMFDSEKFIYSGEIVQQLSKISEKTVRKDFLYRNIVAPLRDEGIIIASSAHGYKIPTSVSDISAYINQTVTVVGPMLSRIGKCRNLIKNQTDGKLDILNEDALLCYKRYFGDY